MFKSTNILEWFCNVLKLNFPVQRFKTFICVSFPRDFQKHWFNIKCVNTHLLRFLSCQWKNYWNNTRTLKYKHLFSNKSQIYKANNWECSVIYNVCSYKCCLSCLLKRRRLAALPKMIVVILDSYFTLGIWELKNTKELF